LIRRAFADIYKTIRALLNSLRPSDTYGIAIVSVETCQPIRSFQFNEILSEIHVISHKTADAVLCDFVP
jgi:hypothetical protein